LLQNTKIPEVSSNMVDSEDAPYSQRKSNLSNFPLLN